MPLAIGAIVGTPAQAQKLNAVMVYIDQPSTLFSASGETAVQLPVLKDTISGRVLDDLTSKPLKGVKVRQKGFENVQAITDSTGRFALGITAGNMAIPFIFELPGYSEVETILYKDIVVKLAAVRTIMLGGISTVSSDQKPLYLVYAGKKSCTIDASRLMEISPEWIEKLEVLKDAKATALYGSKAANGVILIEIKKAFAKKIDFSRKK